MSVRGLLLKSHLGQNESQMFRIFAVKLI